MRAGLAGAAALAAMLASPALAQTRADDALRCAGPDPDGKIVGCSALIAAGDQDQADLAIVYYNRARGHDAKKNTAAALADYTKAAELDPGDTDTYAMRGWLYQRQGRRDDAIADYSRAIALLPGDDRLTIIDAYFRRSELYAQKRLYRQALDDLDRTIALKPHFQALAYNARANVYNKLARYDDAIADENAAIEANPGLERAYYNRGWARMKKGEQDAAIADFTRAIAIKPDFSIFNNRAWAQHLKGDDAGGLADAEEAVKLAPKNPFCLGTRGVIYEKLGRRDDAMADYRAALAIDPKDAEAIEGLKRLGAS
ncbi:MAG TPA: tetratricopeptide repeat protein [Stellaceae bacterium]